MIRRDFFKAVIAAASAAICAGRGAVAAVPAGKQAALTTARPLTKAPTLKEDPRAFIRELLKKAAVVSFSRTARFDGFVWEAEYVYDEKGRYPVNLNDELKRFLPENAAMLSCEVVIQTRDADIIDCGAMGLMEFAPAAEPERRIIIQWLVP